MIEISVNNKYVFEEKKLSEEITRMRNRQRILREQWLFLDIKINALQAKLKDMYLKRTGRELRRKFRF